MASTPKKDSNVSVGVRVRPLNEKEINGNMPVYFSTSSDGTTVQEMDENGVVVKHWAYDHVFGPTCTNLEVFQTMGMKLVDGALEGYNTVMFMYGQTSSGKTFTLFGGQNILGVVQHAMEYLYQKVMGSTETEYVIKLTYAELYNEEIRDLLSPTPNENLKIIDDPNLGPLIQNITEANFTTAANVKALLEEGEQRRHFGVTNMNAHSSRSHVIVRLHIESRKVTLKPANPLRPNWGKDRPHCISTLNLVDLAGSERANKAGTSGQSLKEGSYINRSLLTLGTVIANLSEGKLQHIPYRNSKLTRLLATALGGNAKTCVVTCISPASGNVAESLNTLRFATRAKRIVNIVHKNEVMDMKALTNKLSLQMAEIEHLRQQLDISRQLGFTEDGEIGESLKEKAVVASRSLRSLRFLMRDGPRIMNGLRSVGAPELAKKVLQDIKGALVGGKDLGGMVEEYSNIINNYLPSDRKLLSRISNIALQNEAEMIINVQEGCDSKDEEAHSDEECEEISNLFEFGGEEVREQLEVIQLEREDVRSAALNYISKMKNDITDCQHREKALRKSLDDAQNTIIDQTETNRLLKNSEIVLQKQLDDLKFQRKQDQHYHSEQMKAMNAKIGDLQYALDEKDTLIAQKSHELFTKESDNQQLRSQTEQLSKDLQSAISSKKAFEDEVARTRSEMRIQMDRLRNNMHEMLLQGGNEAKVIESQNIQLQKDLDVARDELERVNGVKEHLELELQQIRASIASMRDQEKALREELNVVKDDNIDLSQKLRDARIEVTQLTTSLSFAVESQMQLKNQLQAETRAKEEGITAVETELETMKERFRLKLNDMQIEMDIKDAEIESAQNQLTAKSNFIAKLEQSFTSDISRLEKKLAAQQKLHDILTQQNMNASLSAQSHAQKYQDEIRKLKNKLQEQEVAVQSITEYVEQQEKKLYDEKNSIVHTNNNSFYGSFYHSGDSLSRTGSMVIDMDENGSNASSFYNGNNNNNHSSSNKHERNSSSDLRSSSGEHDEYGLRYVEDVEDVEEDDQRPNNHINKIKEGLSINIAANPVVPKSALKSPKSRPPNLTVSIDLNQNIVNSGRKTAESGSGNNFADFDFDNLHIDSKYYQELLYGLTLATTHMELNLLEEKSIRNYLIKCDHNHKEFENELQYQVQRLSESEEFLSNGQKQLQESVLFHQNNYASLQQRYADLENRFNDHVKELYRVNKLEKVGNIQIQNLEQTVAENKLMVDKLKHEINILKQENQDMKLQQLQLEGKLDEGQQEYQLLQSFCELLQKEKEMLSHEKEELIAKYMQGHYQHQSTASNLLAHDDMDDCTSENQSYDDYNSSSYLRQEDLTSQVLSLTRPIIPGARSRSSSPLLTSSRTHVHSNALDQQQQVFQQELSLPELLQKYRHLANKPYLSTTTIAEERKSTSSSPMRAKTYSEDSMNNNDSQKAYEPLRLSDQVSSSLSSSGYNNTLKAYALNTTLPQYEPVSRSRLRKY